MDRSQHIHPRAVAPKQGLAYKSDSFISPDRDSKYSTISIPYSPLSALCRAWIKDQLRTPKQGHRFPAAFTCDCRIPHLGGPSAVYTRGDAGNEPFPGGT